MAKGLTVKEAKLVKATAQGKNRTEAGLAADPNRAPESARVWASNTLQKTTVKEALHREMAKQGIDMASIVKPVKEGLVAEKVAIVGNGDSAMAEITPDHATRLKAVQIASRWMGVDASDSGSVNVHFHAHQAEQREKYDL